MEYKMINGVPDLSHCNWWNEATKEAYLSGVLKKEDAKKIDDVFGELPSESEYLESCGDAVRTLYSVRTGRRTKDICFKDIFIALIDPSEAEGWQP